MRRTVAVTCATITFAIATVATAPAQTTGPILQRFRVAIINQTSRVLANGVVVNGSGTATATGPTSYALSFPTGPGSLTETVLSTVGGLGPGCVERLSQSGTFTFSYVPTAQPGFSFGGDGTFTQRSLTVFRALPGGGCDTSAAPLVRQVTIDAGATSAFGVG